MSPDIWRQGVIRTVADNVGPTRKEKTVRVLISGATGLIGGALSALLVERGHEPVALQRGTNEGRRHWSVKDRRISDDAFEGVDAVVHLAGEPIGPPFTARKKRKIIESRRVGTSLIAEAVAEHRPAVFVSASAIGYYGDRGEEILTEESGPGEGFLSEVVVEWEAACRPAVEAGVRTVNTRNALVLSDKGDLLKRMSIPFKLGVGGKLGTGEQWWSWITLDDQVRSILHMLETDRVTGPVNVSSPNPVRNKEFAEILGDVLGRPSAIPVPEFALKLALGSDAAEELILASLRVMPEKLLDSGFEFTHPDIRAGLRAAYA